MRRLGLFAVLALAASAAAQETLEVTFASPSQFQARELVLQTQWAVLLFKENTADFDLDAGAGTLTNHTGFSSAVVVTGAGANFPRSDLSESTTPLQAFSASLRFHARWASLYVEADRLSIQAGPANGTIQALQQGAPPESILPSGIAPSNAYRSNVRFVPQATPGFAIPPSDGVAFSLLAEGLRTAEWHRASVSCRSGPCPDGAGFRQVGWENGTSAVLFAVSSFNELRPAGGRLEGSGHAFALATGGAGASIQVNGTLRLARAEAACNCTGTADATVRALGSSSLAGIKVMPSGRLAAQAAVQSLRVDEGPLWTLGGAVAVTAAGGAAWLAFLLLRVLRGRGRARHDIEKAIKDHPGLNYRGLMEATGYADGTVRYHLGRLHGEGRIAVQGEGRMVRYFENHGRYETGWERQLVLRDPGLRQLHDWLASHPSVRLGEVVAAAQEWGVSAATARRHLSRLMQWRLVVARKTGRLRIYQLAQEAGA